MGRRKVEIKRIEEKSSRQVTFSKRRSGLIKKARQLSILCDVQLALIVFSTSGRLYQFSTADSISEVVERYQISVRTEGDNSSNMENESSHGTIRTCKEVIQSVHRRLDGSNSDELSLADFVHMEKELGAHLIQIRERKNQLMMEYVTSLQQKERSLRRENLALEMQIADMQAEDENAAIPVMTNQNPEDDPAPARMKTLTLLPP